MHSQRSNCCLLVSLWPHKDETASQFVVLAVTIYFLMDVNLENLFQLLNKLEKLDADAGIFKTWHLVAESKTNVSFLHNFQRIYENKL